MLVLGFIILIVIGTGMLLLPYSTTNGITLTDALFTSTSAVCVTGLTVRNTFADFTLFGKIIILILIQIGGLGYMSMATFLAILVGRKIGISGRLLIKESLSTASLEGVVIFMKGMLAFVLIAEGIGAVILSARFYQDYPLDEAIMYGVFHSISALNNAGFSLFEESLVKFRGDGVINLTVMLLIIFGGLGFIVIDDLYARIRKRSGKLMVHTSLVLWTTGILIIAGAVLIYISERNYLFALPGTGLMETVYSSLFASVTARTAGFNTMDYSVVQPATIFLTTILMMIGGSPGSTAGGIKTTTISVVIINIWCTIRGRRDTSVFKRRIPEDMVSKSLVILALATIYIAFVTLVIIDMEHTKFLETVFEVVSAFGTVGLSTGDGAGHSFCATFSDMSKGIIIITMLAGRLGPLTLFMALLRQREESIRYPEGRVIIG